MSNENSNLRVGSAGAGLFVGNKQILGGVALEVKPNFYDLHGAKVIIVNSKSAPIELTFETNGGYQEQVDINANTVLFYNIADTNDYLDLINESQETFYVDYYVMTKISPTSQIKYLMEPTASKNIVTSDGDFDLTDVMMTINIY